MPKLDESARVTLDGNGYGAAYLQPLRARERWHVTRLTIQSTSTNLVPTVRVYVGFIGDSFLVDSSYDGALNAGAMNEWVENGQNFIVEWTDGDPGAECIFTIGGER